MTPLARPCTTSLESPAELCPGTMPDGIDAFHSMSSAATVSKPVPTTYSQTRPSHTKPVQCNSHICPPPSKPGKIQPPTTKQHQPAHPQIQLPTWAKFYPNILLQSSSGLSIQMSDHSTHNQIKPALPQSNQNKTKLKLILFFLSLPKVSFSCLFIFFHSLHLSYLFSFCITLD